MARESEYEAEIAYRDIESNEDSSDAFIMMVVFLGIILLASAAYFNV